MTSIPHWRVAGGDDRHRRMDEHVWSSVWWDGEGLHISASEGVERPLFRLRFERGATFDVVPSERLIVASPHSAAIAPLTVTHLLADQVEPRVLAYEGVFIVHASAIEVDGAVVLFLGTSGVGKSTLAASFDQSGAPMLCDDAVIVDFSDGEPGARALYPSLRLHPDSLDALYPDLHPSSALAHYGLKRRLSMPFQANQRAEALPIAAIFALAPQGAMGAFEISPMTPAELCMALVSNSFSLNPADLGLARDKMRDAGLVAERIPAYLLDYPRTYEQLPAVREAILQTVRHSAVEN